MRALIRFLLLGLTLSVNQAFGVELVESPFGYKKLVYRELKVPPSEYENVSVEEETHNFFQFSYNDIAYEVISQPYGALIIMSANGTNLLSLDQDKAQRYQSGELRYDSYNGIYP